MTQQELEEIDSFIDESVCSFRYEWTKQCDKWLNKMDNAFSDNEDNDFFMDVYQKLCDFQNDCY